MRMAGEQRAIERARLPGIKVRSLLLEWRYGDYILELLGDQEM